MSFYLTMPNSHCKFLCCTIVAWAVKAQKIYKWFMTSTVGHHEMTDEEVRNFFKERKKQLVKGINLVDGMKIRRISKGDIEDLESSFFPIPANLMIAFEALFVRRGIEGSSFRQKIANGCSDLLGKNDEEKVGIRHLLTEAYSIRSCIVHGSEYRKPKSDDVYYITDLVSEIEDLNVSKISTPFI